jgi:multiple sugar transport system ATP-binding protein
MRQSGLKVGKRGDGGSIGRRLPLARVRPEHVRVGEGDADAEVVVVEPAGSEALVHLDLAGVRLVARVRPEELPGPGDRVRVAIRPEDVHRFDAEGKRI